MERERKKPNCSYNSFIQIQRKERKKIHPYRKFTAMRAAAKGSWDSKISIHVWLQNGSYSWFELRLIAIYIRNKWAKKCSYKPANHSNINYCISTNQISCCQLDPRALQNKHQMRNNYNWLYSWSYFAVVPQCQGHKLFANLGAQEMETNKSIENLCLHFWPLYYQNVYVTKRQDYCNVKRP